MKRISNVRCCVCGGKIMSEEDLTVCENCNNTYHKICWQDIKEECIYCHNKIKEKENSSEYIKK